jgi:hypothetical protein
MSSCEFSLFIFTTCPARREVSCASLASIHHQLVRENTNHGVDNTSALRMSFGMGNIFIIFSGSYAFMQTEITLFRRQKLKLSFIFLAIKKSSIFIPNQII